MSGSFPSKEEFFLAIQRYREMMRKPQPMVSLQPTPQFIARDFKNWESGIIDVEFEVNDSAPQMRVEGNLTPDEVYMIRKHLGLE